ncbi:hypothetical protein M8J75_002651 [Diaphorina citri]|nr:hypothetical protein M8J75_002651 [Diaphorina citri]
MLKDLSFIRYVASGVMYRGYECEDTQPCTSNNRSAHCTACRGGKFPCFCVHEANLKLSYRFQMGDRGCGLRIQLCKLNSKCEDSFKKQLLSSQTADSWWRIFPTPGGFGGRYARRSPT